MKCPTCKFDGDSFTVAIHLTEAHFWNYAECMDWLSKTEESCLEKFSHL
jgi:hypothetical protein